MTKDQDAPFNEDVIVEQRGEPTMEEMAEAFYWGTIHDFVELMGQYGTDKVLEDLKAVVDYQKENSQTSEIIVP